MTPRKAESPTAEPGAPGPTASVHEPLATTPEARAAWLADRRWYAGSDSAEPGTLAVTLATASLPVTPALAVGLLDTDRGDRYQLLLAQEGGPDVADDPDAAERLGRWIASGTASAASPGVGTVSAHWPSAADRLGPAAARPLSGEQSNTSVVIGGTHVLKLFRRLRPGPHPEIEVGRHLAHAADNGTTAPVARLAGWYELEPADGSPATALGVAQELVPGALDAWGLVLSALAGDPTGLLARLHELGRSLAQLHDALALPAAPGGPAKDRRDPEAFGSVPLKRRRLADLAVAVSADARRVLGTGLDRPAALAPVLGRDGDVTALLERQLARLGTDLGAAIRHHGDLHLGQIVLGSDGWVFLDFEGEPTRSLDERRQRHSPLRDVAGMLRSLAYAAATHRRADGHHLAPGWEPAARAAFLDGYLATVDPGLLPTSAAATHTLLTLLELEKVVYEIDYELGHRPDWVGLPVEGLVRLLDQDRR